MKPWNLTIHKNLTSFDTLVELMKVFKQWNVIEGIYCSDLWKSVMWWSKLFLVRKEKEKSKQPRQVKSDLSRSIFMISIFACQKTRPFWTWTNVQFSLFYLWQCFDWFFSKRISSMQEVILFCQSCTCFSEQEINTNVMNLLFEDFLNPNSN